MTKLKKGTVNFDSSFWKKVKRDVPISSYTTLGVGGPAKYFIEVKDIPGLEKAVKECRKNKIGFCVVGGGSDLFASDQGYAGMLVLNKIVYKKDLKEGKFTVGSGTVLQDFINFTIGKGYAGLEKMSGIPGTVGGAIYGNAGAYGQTISDYLNTVLVFDGLRKRVFKKKDCKFNYRESVFKKNRYSILEAEFLLEKGDAEFLKKISLDTIQLRSQKYFPGIKCPGSFFKNVLVESLKPSQLKFIPQDKITYGKIPAGFLMESVGAKGAEKGGAKIADHHGNLIMNMGSASSEELLELANTYANKVEKKFGIKLELEVQLLGFENDNG